MIGCPDLERYRDRELSPDQRFAFENHLGECVSCREATIRWGEIESEIVSVTTKAEKSLPGWSEKKKDQLVREAAAYKLEQPRGRLRPIAVAAAAALVVGLSALFVDVNSGDEKAAPINLTARLVNGERVYPIVLSGEKQQTIASPQRSRVLLNIGDDIVGLAPNSRLKFIELSPARTRLFLESGTVACSIAHEASEREFIVETGQLVVRVTGTRFSVLNSDSGGAHIDVVEGSVQVTDNHQRTRVVAAGQRLRIPVEGEGSLTTLSDAAREKMAFLMSDQPLHLRELRHVGHDDVDEKSAGEREPSGENAGTVNDLDPLREDEIEAEVASAEAATGANAKQRSKASHTDSHAEWRHWIIQGRLGDAEREIAAHLQRAEKDKEAWSLLADCRRKGGDYQGAVVAYRKVIVLASPAEANQARFRAGKLLQEKLGFHREAIDLFEEYVRSKSGNNMLEAEALLRMARSHHATGRVARARKLLEEVADGHSGTAAAAQARRMLTEIQGK